MARRQPVLQKDHPDQPERNDGPRIQDHHTRAVGAGRDHYLDNIIFDFRNSILVNDSGCNFVDFLFFFFVFLIFVLIFVFVLVLFLVFLIFLIFLVLVLFNLCLVDYDCRSGDDNFVLKLGLVNDNCFQQFQQLLVHNDGRTVHACVHSQSLSVV